jgi:hypothetical protein
MHDRTVIASAIRNRACDLVGVARPATLIPDLPLRILLNREVDASKARAHIPPIPRGELVKGLLGAPTPASGRVSLVGASVATVWHEWQMARIGRGEDPDPQLDWLRGVVVNTLWYDIFGGGPRGWFLRWMGEW